MTTYARIVGGSAVDITTENPATLFHADVASEFQAVPDGTQHGDRLNADGTWTKFASLPTPAPTAAPLPLLAPLDFYIAFTPAERRAIKASTDADVQEFWDTYERCEKAGKPIDPNSNSVNEGLQKLAVVGHIAAARIPDIRAGVPQ